LRQSLTGFLKKFMHIHKTFRRIGHCIQNLLAHERSAKDGYRTERVYYRADAQIMVIQIAHPLSGKLPS
jgi:hypothetical protein